MKYLLRIAGVASAVLVLVPLISCDSRAGTNSDGSRNGAGSGSSGTNKQNGSGTSGGSPSPGRP